MSDAAVGPSPDGWRRVASIPILPQSEDPGVRRFLLLLLLLHTHIYAHTRSRPAVLFHSAVQSNPAEGDEGERGRDDSFLRVKCTHMRARIQSMARAKGRENG